jgi:hypothetical protein
MHRFSQVLIGSALCVACAGCAGREAPLPPLGPKVLVADVQPLLVDAPSVEFTGLVEHFYVESRWGSYLTWALHPAGPHEGCELDVRACPTQAAALNNRIVTVRGRLILRGPRHLPLLVASVIEPHRTTSLARRQGP